MAAQGESDETVPGVFARQTPTNPADKTRAVGGFNARGNISNGVPQHHAPDPASSPPTGLDRVTHGCSAASATGPGALPPAARARARARSGVSSAAPRRRRGASHGQL